MSYVPNQQPRGWLLGQSGHVTATGINFGGGNPVTTGTITVTWGAGGIITFGHEIDRCCFCDIKLSGIMRELAAIHLGEWAVCYNCMIVVRPGKGAPDPNSDLDVDLANIDDLIVCVKMHWIKKFHRKRAEILGSIAQRQRPLP